MCFSQGQHHQGDQGHYCQEANLAALPSPPMDDNSRYMYNRSGNSAYAPNPADAAQTLVQLPPPNMQHPQQQQQQALYYKGSGYDSRNQEQQQHHHNHSHSQCQHYQMAAGINNAYPPVPSSPTNYHPQPAQPDRYGGGQYQASSPPVPPPIAPGNSYHVPQQYNNPAPQVYAPPPGPPPPELQQQHQKQYVHNAQQLPPPMHNQKQHIDYSPPPLPPPATHSNGQHTSPHVMGSGAPTHHRPMSQSEPHYQLHGHSAPPMSNQAPSPPPLQHQYSPSQRHTSPGGNYGHSRAETKYYSPEPIRASSPLAHQPYHSPPPPLQQQQHQQPSTYAHYSAPAVGAQPMASDAPLAPLLHHHSTSQYASHPPPPLHIQQAQQMQQMQMRKSPSPVPLSQAQMRREHSYRTASGQQGPGQIASTWPSMGTRQDTRNNYPEHHASYITGQTPISSVLTAEPIVAGINMPNLTMQRSHGPGPDGGYAGSPPQVPSMLSSRRREQSFYDYSRDSGAVPPPVGRPGSMSTLVSSMGSMSLRPPQTNHGLAHGQQSQSLIGSSASGAALFQGSQVAWQNYSSGNPPPVVHTQSNPAHNSSAMSLPPSAIHSAHTIHGPVVQSMPELHGSSSTVNQPGSGGGSNMVYPLWSNINADGFHAYQHHIPVETSNFSGTKYALIIGINYYNKDYSQTSNINSAHAFRNILVSRFGYLEKNVTLLSDDQQDLRSHPTYSLITSNMKRMMREVRPNDSVFFYYCGFGKLPMQVQDKRSETLSAIRRLRSDYILPGDFETAGAIDAAYLHKYLVRQLPQSARLTALLNCIVNETGLGVPYKYTQPNGMAVLTNAIAGSNLFEANVGVNPGSNASFGDLSQRFETNLMQQYPQGSPTVDPETEMSRLQQSSGDIVVFSWDRDYANPNHRNYLSHTPSNQLGNYWGAAMESALRDKPKPTYGDMLGYLHDSTKSLVMLPFIASGRKISMSEPFDI